MSESAAEFASLLRAAQPTPAPGVHLTNVSFFLGAGFSKSWDARFPVGDELFSFSYDDWYKHDGPLEEFLNLNNYQTFSLDISASMFKDLVYQIGMMKKYPEMRPRYIDDQNLEMVEKHLRYLVRMKFEETAPIYYEENEKLVLPQSLASDQQHMLRFFSLVERSGDGSQGLPEGLRANYLTNNYDFVIEAILDGALGPDDSYSLYKYRGITPVRYNGREPATVVFDNWMTGKLLKINGGFEVLRANDGFEFDYRKPEPAAVRANPPQLMLASREQDYTQAYFRAMFPKVIRLLHETSVLVVVGYSLPEEDALLRLIIRQFAEDRVDGNRKALFYVSTRPEGEQLEKVNGVFPHVSNVSGLTVLPYCGSFSAWCEEVLDAFRRSA